MNKPITGTVVDGGLSLDEPLDLPENSRVTITVEPMEDWRAKQEAGVEGLLRLIREKPIDSGGKRFTRDELHERD